MLHSLVLAYVMDKVPIYEQPALSENMHQGINVGYLPSRIEELGYGRASGKSIATVAVDKVSPSSSQI